MKVSFHGAARCVTGSKHLISLDNGKKILLDCGLFQGMGSETAILNTTFGFRPKEIDYVILSHAHIDHVGLLPKLVMEGFRGKIFCTSATKAFAELLLEDSGKIQQSEASFINKRRKRQGRELIIPLYTQDDVPAVIEKIQTIKIREWYQIDKDVKVLHTDAGHIIGSTCVHLEIKEGEHIHRITFSGDVGRYNDTILRAPDIFPQADIIIMESTYGNRLHDKITSYTEQLLKLIVETCILKRGKLIIPSFSLGRTQELLYALNTLSLQKRLPPVAYYVDSPLSVETTELTKHYPQLFNDQVQEVLKRDDDPFDFKGLKMIKDVEASKALNFNSEPAVIISSSGMAEAGRVKHHISNNIENSKNTILLVGYCEPNSLGGRLKAKSDEVKIFGKIHQVNARIEEIVGMSAHGDYTDLLHWLEGQDVKKVKRLFLVHGEYEAQVAMREHLMEKGFKNIEIPDMHQSFEI
ncbi:MAG TPA: MBL fold metallo-hydrolase [Edaphocola sp.]|nr:MBL fold metallo-hydrolase [Edaphocola sp.]